MKRWLKFLVSFGVLGLLLSLLPWHEVAAVWRDVSWTVWAAVLGGFIAVHFAGVFKWRIILNTNTGGSRLRVFDASKFYAAGLFANLCLPSIVGGDVLRAALAAKRIGAPEAVVLGGLADRMIDTAALGILIAAGVLLTGSMRTGWSIHAGLLVFLAVGLAAVFALVVITRRPLHRWAPKYRRMIARSLLSLRRMRRNPQIAAGALVLALAMQTAFVLLNAWLGRSVGIDLPLAVWMFAWPVAKAAGMLPVSVGGLGVRDATLAALLVPFGVPAAQGLVVSLVWQTVLLAGGLLGGLFWWLSRRAGEARAEALSLAATSRTHG